MINVSIVCEKILILVKQVEVAETIYYVMIFMKSLSIVFLIFLIAFLYLFVVFL